MLHRLEMIACAGLTTLLFIGCQQRGTSVTNTSTDHPATMHSEREHDLEHENDGHDKGINESGEAKIDASLGNLNSEDRQLAESQRYCAVMNHNLLGSMGTPIKIDVNGEPVFLCCAGCKVKALRNPEDTLAKVAALKTNNAIHQ